MTEPEYSKVTVRIYGQEYTVASAESKERILQIADHVDEMMRGLSAKGAGGSPAALAMLAAVNISAEFFSGQDAQRDALREQEQLEKEIAHYQQLWEEAKRTHLQYKEDAKEVQEQKDSLQERLNAKSIEMDNMIHKAEERDGVIARLETDLEQTNGRLRAATEQSDEEEGKARELAEKLKEIEGNYFELQMENVRMKGDLERYRGGQ
ncbi:MAG: cell division protein ZapA [Clostridiales bacterium]|nr:cell division protein ZapA [Clostridiales bacterium]